MHAAAFNEGLLRRAKAVRLAVFDVDGVLTDGRLHYAPDGDELKVFHVRDGLGLQMLRHCGIQTALITARSHPALARRAQEMGVTHCFENQERKWDCLAELLRSLGLQPEQTSYMGDDLPDLACLKRVGLAAVPADAHPWVRDAAHFQAPECGGHGAARALCDLLVIASGQVDPLVRRYAEP